MLLHGSLHDLSLLPDLPYSDLSFIASGDNSKKKFKLLNYCKKHVIYQKILKNKFVKTNNHKANWKIEETIKQWTKKWPLDIIKDLPKQISKKVIKN